MIAMKKKATHSDVGHLAERLVREMRRLLIITRLVAEVVDSFKRDIALFGNHGYHARVRGLRGSVKFECHMDVEDDFWCGCAAVRLTPTRPCGAVLL